jgi:hypothetical protein
MELGCTRRGFGRDVQPAAPNRPRCGALVGLTLGVRLVEALLHGGSCYPLFVGIGGEPVSSYGAGRCRGNSTHTAEAYYVKWPGRPGAGAQKRYLACSAGTMIFPG